MMAACSSNLFSTASASPSSVLRSSDQLYEVLTLACELLPALPDASLPIPASELFSVPRPGVPPRVTLSSAGFDLPSASLCLTSLH